MKRFRWRWSAKRLTPILVLITGLAVLLTLAIMAPGFPVKKLDLHDSGIWVTSDKDGLFGRLNKSVAALDGSLTPPGQAQAKYQLDTLQDGGYLAALDSNGGRLIPIDPATLTFALDRGVTLAANTSIAMAGGTIAALDPETGDIRAVRYQGQPRLDIRPLDKAQSALTNLANKGEVPKTEKDQPPPTPSLNGTPAALTVGVDGTVHALTATGTSLRIAATETGFDKPQFSDLKTPFTQVQLTAIGENPVVLDGATGTLLDANGNKHQVPADREARLQAPSPAAEAVFLATSDALLKVGKTVETIHEVPKGATAAPTVLNGCTFAAWAGTPGHVIRACTGGPAVAQKVDRKGALIRPTFRVNRQQIVLNDQADGRVFDLDLQKSVDNWDEIKPKQEDDQEQKDKKQTDEQQNQDPKANNDRLGARANRTTVMHVLDNDADPTGNILSIAAVTQPSTGSVAIAPDGQSVQFTMPPEGANTSFTYSISNGVKVSKPATVEVVFRRAEENEAPKRRAGASEMSFTVASWGSVLMPVTGDYRDFDGDPVTVVSAKLGEAKLPVTPDGRIDFTAGKADALTKETVKFALSDGVAAQPVDGQASVTILAHNATDGTPPITQPDAARGEVGKPITIKPLLNDIPGSDPLNPRTTMTLGAKVQATDVVKTTTDEKAGLITVTADKPGTFFLNYSAAFGSSRFAPGQIRVDVSEATNDSKPIPVPDQVAIHGQVPAMVDVLANDFDPMGSVLAVQSASVPKQYADQVQVAVLRGRWVRIMPLTDQVNPNPFVVTYTVSNGLSEAVPGSISVTQLPRISEDRAILRDDFAVVRDGDTTLIPVLNNDSSESGAPLVLDANVPKLAAGQLKVIDPAVAEGADAGDVGRAYVVGDRVRYVAPEKVEKPRQFRIEYVASTVGGQPQTAVISVTVNPQPSETLANQGPDPIGVEARAVAGDTITIDIDTAGRDPDGDSIMVTGIASAPKLGRVLSHTPVSITYQAYPNADAIGTDSFTYQVRDRYGKTATASVRVALTPPGQTQPPVAIADVMTVRPGADVHVNPLGNDMVATGDQATIVDLARVNQPVPPGVKLVSDQGPVDAKGPAADAPPLVIGYALTGSGGVGPSATITINSRDGYLNPPRVFDQVAPVISGAKTAKVDLLRGAWDPDGDPTQIRVTRLAGLAAPTVGGEIELPVTGQIQLIPFEVTDGDGATSAAVVIVPAEGDGPPRLKAGGLIKLAENTSTSVNLADYVESPRGKAVRITVAESLSAAPNKHLDIAAESDTSIKLTAKNDYVGPGSLTVEVMDAKDMTDPEALRAYVSIPVQVGPETPVLRCPKSAQQVMQGGQPVVLDIVSLCHVWTADPAQARQLVFTADWDEPITSVSADGGERVTIKAAGDAVPEAKGKVKIGVKDSKAIPAILPVEVLRAPKPRLVLNALRDIKQGTSVTQTMALTSPLLDAQPTLISITQASGMPATATFEGTSFTITPGPDSHGTMTFTVVASDLADVTRTDRHVTGTLTVITYGRPEAPNAPVPGQQIQSKSASLTWTPRADNGAPIEEFELKWAGPTSGTKSCGRATRCDVGGLRNGSEYTFQVRARNKADWSEWSGNSAPVTPDEPPGAAANFTASNPQDHTLTLSWQAAPVDGTPVTAYHIKWGGGSQDVSGTSTSTTINGLDNNTAYTFTIVAENRAGVSKLATTTKGQSAGAPVIKAPQINSSDLGDKAQVRVSWAAANPNGWTPVTYTLLRSDGQSYPVGQNTSASHDVTYDGTKYAYTVKACNAAPGDGHCTTSGTTSWTAVGKPAKPPTPQLRATGSDNELELSAFTVPLARGARAEVSVVGSITQQLASQAGTSSFQVGATRLRYSNGQTAYVKIRLCNESGACIDSDETSATPYGPLSTPDLSDPNASGQAVSASASGNGNGANATLILYLNGQECDRSGPSAGQLSVSCRREIGYSKDAKFYAKIEDASGNGRGSKDSSEKSVRTPPPPPPPPPPDDMHVEAGQSGATPTLTVKNFVAPGVREVRCWNATAATYDFYSNYLGKVNVNIPKNGTVSVPCPHRPKAGVFTLEVYTYAWTGPYTWKN